MEELERESWFVTRAVTSLLLSCALAAPVAAKAQDSPIYASFYTGLSIDAFAADSLRRYLNPEQSGNTRERLVAGFNFGYRLLGDSTGRQLWLYGETIHGVRSADVDCQENPDLPLCQQNPFDPTNAPEKTLAILREATSLEAFVGLRWEFLTIQDDTDDVAALYVKGQAGFLTVSEFGGDLVDVHHVGAGLTVTGGDYAGSYIEFGFGRTDLYKENSGRRLKVDAYLSWTVGLFEAFGAYPFAEITVDSDFGKGSDSVQSYLGIDFSLDCLLGGKFGTDCSG